MSKVTIATTDENGIITQVEQYTEDSYLQIIQEPNKYLIDPDNNANAGVGMQWDEAKEMFIPAQPYTSWVLYQDDLTYGQWQWKAPVDKPADAGDDDGNGGMISYTWNEDAQSWDLDE